MHLAQALPNLTLLSRKAELRFFVPESQIPATLENSHRVLALLTKLTLVCYRSSMPSTAHCAALQTFYRLTISICEAFVGVRPLRHSASSGVVTSIVLLGTLLFVL